MNQLRGVENNKNVQSNEISYQIIFLHIGNDRLTNVFVQHLTKPKNQNKGERKVQR